MASEPKKPVEQMLEALAKARRAEFGADPKMPNPMRARLHEEIARAGTAVDDEVESRVSWVTRFWPRVTVAAALATLVVLVPAIWWNQSHPPTAPGGVAVRDRTAGAYNGLKPAVPAENTVAKAPAPSATEPTVNLADNSQIKIEPAATPASEAEALSSSTRVLQGRGATEFPTQATKGFLNREIAGAKRQSAPAAASAASGNSKAKPDALAAAAPPVAQPSSADSLATAQQFSQQSTVQSFRNTAQINRPANVLNTFQVQQQGDEIRVLDADGSTYTGKIEQLAKSAEVDSRTTVRRAMAEQARRQEAQPGGETESAAPQPYFRAAGYNVTLKKTLVFEGNYAAPPAEQPAIATSNDRERAAQSRDRTRIVGTVRVNGEAPIQVDAIAGTKEPSATKKPEK
jgi:hypothetical protein